MYCRAPTECQPLLWALGIQHWARPSPYPKSGGRGDNTQGESDCREADGDAGSAAHQWSGLQGLCAHCGASFYWDVSFLGTGTSHILQDQAGGQTPKRRPEFEAEERACQQKAGDRGLPEPRVPGDREGESRSLTPGASVLGVGPGQEGRGGSRLTQRESPRKSIQHGLLNRGILLFSLLKTQKPFPPNWGWFWN